MLFHPAIIIIFFVLLSLLFYSYNNSFLKLIAFLSPVMSGFALFLGKGRHCLQLYNLSLVWQFNNLNKLIGLAFLLVLLSANIYTIGQKRYKELIIGLTCCASGLFGLLGEDFISMFSSLEIMMIMSSILIFISNDKGTGKNFTSTDCAKRYFLIHFLASNMILVGISYVIYETNSLEITSINGLMKSSQHIYIISLMLAGMLINVAAFPFCGWMINYYKKSSGCAFLYLISFSTKLPIIIIIKNFYGFGPLKYIGLATILYSGIKAVREDCIFALLSQLSIIATGIILIGISYVNELMLASLISYLFINIIYKLLLTTIFVTFKDIKNISLCSELGRFTNFIILIPMIIGLLLMAGFPFSFAFYTKIAVSRAVSDQVFYIIILFSGMLTIICFPWKELINSSKKIALEINIYSKLSLIFSSMICFIAGFLWRLTPIRKIDFPYGKECYFYNDLLKQLIIYGISIFIIKIFRIKRKENNNSNIFEQTIDSFFFLYGRWKKLTLIKSKSKDQKCLILKRQLVTKISILNNQQSLVFFTVSLLIFMLTYLLIVSNNN